VSGNQDPVWAVVNVRAERAAAIVAGSAALIGVVLVVLIGLVPGDIDVAGADGMSWRTWIGVASAACLVLALVLVFRTGRSASSRAFRELRYLALALAIAVGLGTVVIGGFAVMWTSVTEPYFDIGRTHDGHRIVGKESQWLRVSGSVYVLDGIVATPIGGYVVRDGLRGADARVVESDGRITVTWPGDEAGVTGTLPDGVR
jgi:hypothetical protein